MIKTIMLACAAFVLSGCATSRVADIPPAHQADPPAATAVATGPATDAPRVLMSTLPGWVRFDIPSPSGDAAVGFRNDAARAVITAKAIRAEGAVLSEVLLGVARLLATDQHVTCAPQVAEGTYASMRCTGDEGPTRGLVAIRRPSGRADLLLLMTGIWPASLPESFDEEVDLMFLIATVE